TRSRHRNDGSSVTALRAPALPAQSDSWGGSPPPRMMPGAVDLHTHTTASDGTFTPRELVGEAATRGLRVLAVTDHDSTEGLAEALDEAARRPPLQIVPGIEINCDVEGAEIHVLGYYVDYEAVWFQEFCRAQREERRARIYRMTDRLAALGLPVDP